MIIKEAIAYPTFELLRACSEELSMPAYVVGGYVRDYLLGHECKDIDIVVEGSGIAIAREFA